MLNSINDINTKVTKLFHNPNINFFIIMMLILLISCYTLINTSLKYAISSFISNPIIILFSLILVILLGYYNINISILFLLLLFIALYGTTIFNGNSKNIANITSKPTKSSMIGKIEGFINNKNYDTDDDSDNDSDNDSDDEDDEDNINVPKITKSPYKTYEEKDSETDETVKKIKDTLLGPMADIKNSGENEFKQKLLENKQIQYLSEKKNNRNSRNNNTNKQNFTNTGSKSKKENFQTIKLRKFDPSKEEDTNFLITKEILQDMVIRIDYNYESSPYLKKYIKHRVEEIVDINKLLEDDD